MEAPVWLLRWWSACAPDPEGTEPIPRQTPAAVGEVTVPPTPFEPAWGLDRRPPNPTCLAPARPRPMDVGLVRQFPALSFGGDTTVLTRRPNSPWWYVAEKDGRIVRFPDEPDASGTEVVLDIVPQVAPGRELGLLGLAFHPDFDVNGRAFVVYTALGAVEEYELVLAEFHSPDGGATLDPASEVELLRLGKRYEGHQAGNVDFGPDGYLYFGIGDGGGFVDPDDHAQDPMSLFGKILRLDVDRKPPGRPYGIPPDNPFLQRGHRPEIYALGFRNPWRWSFDPVTGELWAGDVGRDTIEEIDLVVAGGNYGWRLKEGPRCNQPVVDCDPGGLTEPVVSYTREFGHAVVGGHVYRGSALPELAGQYLFDDFGGDTVYRIVGAGEAARMEALVYGAADVVDWAYGEDGESWLLGLGGTIWRLERVPPDPAPALSPTLSGTGCFEPGAPTRPVAALIPFTPAHPFWSDGLGKDRWLALPDGQKMTVRDDGDLAPPVGSVLVKEFAEDGVRIETRMLVHHPDGWAGYAWKWREDQSDADLLEGSEVLQLPGRTWTIPSRSECLRCHTDPAGPALGLELRQLDTDQTWPTTGRVANQLTTLSHLGMLPEKVRHPGAMPAKDGPESVEARARAWLHVNCSSCHQNGGGTPVDLVLTETTPLAETGLCERPSAGAGGIEDAWIVAPGDPSRSVASARVHALGTGQMPPLGRATVDEVGAALLDQWITELASCP